MMERYTFTTRLADGGRGRVFRARDTRTGREVAVKRAHAGVAGASKELQAEAQMLRRVRHENVVELVDEGVDDEGSYLVLELVEGETLEETLKHGPLALAAFDHLARQSLAGVQALHAAGVLHLDLKPENLMLQRGLPGNHEGNFRVKVLDFGLARPLGTEVAEKGLPGSVHFMAPEQFRKQSVDERTDLYALGCLFYQALSGKRPFEGETSPQVVVAHLYHRHVPLATLRPDLPPALTAWVEGLMSLKPEDRPVSAQAALEDYQQLANS